MERKVNTYGVQIYFKNPVWVELWNEEFSGQLSDGAWENTKNAEWLWRDCICIQGEEDKLITTYLHEVKKRRFNFYKELDCVHDRMLETIQKTNKDYTIKDLKIICDGMRDFLKNTEIVFDPHINSRKYNYQKAVEDDRQEKIKEFAEAHGFGKIYSAWVLQPTENYDSRIQIKNIYDEGQVAVEVKGARYYITSETCTEFVEAVKSISKFSKI